MASSVNQTGTGQSLDDPIVFGSSQTINTYSSQQSGFSSSQPASASASTQNSLASTQTSLVSAGGGRIRWTTDQEIALVRTIKDNLQYQTLLRGHAKNPSAAANKDGKIKKAGLWRMIALEIFPTSEQRNAHQMQQKLNGLCQAYDKEIAVMSETGQGMLLEDMTPGTRLRTQRELLLARYPWFEHMHAMMRDRASSDPDIYVNNAGEHRTGVDHGNAGERRADDGNQDDNQDEDDEFADMDLENDGLSFQARREMSRASCARIYDDDDDDEEQDQLVSSQISPSISRGRTASHSPEVPLSLRHPINSSRPRPVPINGRTAGSSALPSLLRLSEQSNDDSMRAGAVGSQVSSFSGRTGTPSATSSSVKHEREHSPRREPRASSSSSQKAKAQGKGRATVIDDVLDEFSRGINDDQEIQLEREQTKRRKLELRSQQLTMQSQERERNNELLSSRLAVIESRIEGLQGILFGVGAKLDTILSKLGSGH